jgi:hydroxypyruvate isomerase
MDRKHFLTAAGAAAGMAAVGGRPARAAEMSEEELRNLGKTDVKIALRPGMFGGKDFLKQLEQVARHGYPAFERLGAGGIDHDATRKKMDELGLVWTCIGAGVASIGNPKNWRRGLGISDEEQHEQCEKRFRANVETAKKLGVKRLLALTGQKRQDMTADQQTAIVVKGLKRLAPIAEKNDVTIVVEILNVLVSHPGYFLVYTPQGAEIVDEVNHPNVKLLYDIYHQQISEGNLINNIRKYIKQIGHFHIGDNPGRQWPTTGEINYKNVFKAVRDTGYEGYLAIECGLGPYKPLEALKILHDLTTFG